jgi:hypothetical protein
MRKRRKDSVNPERRVNMSNNEIKTVIVDVSGKGKMVLKVSRVKK